MDHQGGHERQMAFVRLSNLSLLQRAWLTAFVAALLCLAATALAVAETKSDARSVTDRGRIHGDAEGIH
ncbi:hypothetical protein, partial [Mesorhizobium sp. M7A.F.Ca.CA.002.09.1.1]|uniref:hypothetical protein n=1 Tax=Mesorhizobium sp. M7A.F.Ca.CA.002.09.1.1 TaxID=2496739 RepID=UPI0019D1BB6F